MREAAEELESLSYSYNYMDFTFIHKHYQAHYCDQYNYEINVVKHFITILWHLISRTSLLYDILIIQIASYIATTFVYIHVYTGLKASDIHIDISPHLKQSGVLDKSECSTS